MSEALATPTFTASRNACKLCAPLGACLALRGVEGAVPLLHGSQGCATYIRRYMISHFKEPLDIASSNFGEMTAIFGGRENLRLAVANIIRQYEPRLVGIATTCLAETIGDDVPLYLREMMAEAAASAEGHRLPPLVHVSTPSYSGTHAEGYWAAVAALVGTLAEGGPREARVGVLPGIVSPADLRYLKEVFRDFNLPLTLLPDYSETLDAGMWNEYHRIPPGGTPVDAIRRLGAAQAAIEFVATLDLARTPAAALHQRFGVARHSMPMPIGMQATDRLFAVLEALSGRPTPAEHAAERGRLVDCYVDAHKYIFGRRVVVYGEQDLVAGLAGFLAEIGAVPVLCASGAETGRLNQAVAAAVGDACDLSETEIIEGIDFADIEQRAAELQPDLIVGSSKGYKLARALQKPLVRVGFPIHDRIDGPRLMTLGYRGAQQLFDRVVNAVIETSQDGSSVGYSYM